jgi:hypothetical protein
VRTVVCSDQFYNVMDEGHCTYETDIDDRIGPYPTKDQFDGAITHWSGGSKPISERTCNDHPCADFTCYKSPTKELVIPVQSSGYPDYILDPQFTAITTDENTADNTCSSIYEGSSSLDPHFYTTCFHDVNKDDCARCLPGGCQCSWEPVKHLCVSCDIGGSACVGSIPDGDKSFFFWEESVWGPCDEP